MFFLHALHLDRVRSTVGFVIVMLLAIVDSYSQPVSSTQVLIGSFRGNDQRNYYGDNCPDKLDLIWKYNLGSGKTTLSRSLGERVWKGGGWTGQPLLVKENEELFLIQGAYDHHLRKIRIRDKKEVWRYKFDDVVKGTGSIWASQDTLNKMMIVQGSRLGYGKYLDTQSVPSLRAISYLTGEELWRHDSKRTSSYSRDVDGSALIVNDTLYIGLENGLFVVMNPDFQSASMKDSLLYPKVYEKHKLYDDRDVVLHKHNVVTESSPALLGDHIYIASGSGHVYGYNMKTRSLDWDYYIGSDLDGSCVVTSDSCLLVTVEKQYIEGEGGIIKLNPRKSGDEAIEWYFPTRNKAVSTWEGGIIGTAGINDFYVNNTSTCLAVVAAMDGYMYVIAHKETPSEKTSIYDGKSVHPKGKLVYKSYIGSSISSPIILKDKIVAPSYSGIFLFKYDEQLNFALLDKFPGTFEASPIVWDKKIYIASRDGYLYCLGDK